MSRRPILRSNLIRHRNPEEKLLPFPVHQKIESGRGLHLGVVFRDGMELVAIDADNTIAFLEPTCSAIDPGSTRSMRTPSLPAETIRPSLSGADASSGAASCSSSIAAGKLSDFHFHRARFAIVVADNFDS